MYLDNEEVVKLRNVSIENLVDAEKAYRKI